MENYVASDKRYDAMRYVRCGRSGVLLPQVSLGMWHNFGGIDDSRSILRHAFDRGITHLDLANNYGPPYGSAEETLGRVMDEDLRPYRDELFISTKAGYDMWAGPYGNWGSRKYLMASLDQSLRRMHLEYVDLFSATTPTLPWKRRCRRLSTSSVRARRSMWASPTGHWNHYALASTT